MAITARNVVVAMGLVAVGLAGTTPAAFGAEPELPALRILVITMAGVPPPETLARAQAETARIYADVGVRLAWTDPVPSLPHLIMRIIPRPNGWSAANDLGAVPDGTDGMGRLAYAFYERIEASAQRHGTAPAKILGHVMTHEMGHILLARRAHSSTGIMRGHWDQFEIHSVERSLLRFTNEQARSIRRTVADMNADHQRRAGIAAR